MTDFDHRVRDSLDAAADHSPDSTVSLVAGAQRRLRRRRTVTGAVGAVVLVAVAVPVAIGLGHSGGGRGADAPVVASDAPSPDVAAGWRTETWRDLTVQVPATWGHGALDQWCMGADGDGPQGQAVVHRPEDAQTDVGCQPGQGYGIDFFDPATDARHWVKEPGAVWQYVPGDVSFYPDGAWLGYDLSDHAGIVVVAEDRATVEHVLTSARRVDVDANNCWTNLGTTHFGDYLDPDHLSVCRYGGDGWLQQSELLSAEDTTSALADIGRGAMVDGSTGCAGTDDTQIELGHQFVVTLTDQCPQGNQIALSGTIHELTERDLYWALSPGWSGGVDGSVPLPKQLRH